MPEDTTQPQQSVIMPSNGGAVDPNAATMAPPTGFSLPTPSSDPTAAPVTPAVDSSAPELPATPADFGLPTDVTPAAPAPADAVTTPDETGVPAASFPSFSDAPSTDATPVAVSDDLAGIKQQALEQLSPLVGQLDQTPEEKFRTTMMMIQASDNKDLVKTAFEAAQQITDEKARAQALLDVINEINYFSTQQHPDSVNQ